MKSIFIIFSIFIGACLGFDKGKFLSHCKDVAFYGMDLRNYEFLVCENVYLSKSDSESFKSNQFNISSKEYITFEGGNLGVVNGDFFKQFPKVKMMEFEDTFITLKPSRTLANHPSLEILKITSSNVSGNHQTNALHSLLRLKEFVLENCFLEDTAIDGVLLQESHELKKLSLIDDKNHPSIQGYSLIRNINEDAFDSLRNLEDLNLHVENMTQLSPNYFKNKSKLKNVKLSGFLQEFPKNLPSSLENLSIKYSKIRSLSKYNLKNLRKLRTLRISEELGSISEDAFDGLDDLETLNLSGNKLMSFSPRHLKYNSKISKVWLRKNFMNLKNLDLSSIGLEDDGYGVFVPSKMDLF